ncbi:MAG: hypothetical protein IJ647_10475, partial [Prevotella sp.]|nr:hypothetical protein [Prevotella sp.]
MVARDAQHLTGRGCQFVEHFRLEKYKADGKSDIRLVEDSAAKPLWARYYDLEKGEPFFCDRDGQPK